MKTITIKCPKDIYGEIIKCRYFPSTELIQPGDEVKFVSDDCNRYCIKCGKHTWDKEFGICICGENKLEMKMNIGILYDNGILFGTHKATPIVIKPNIMKSKNYIWFNVGHQGITISEKLYNWIKENFKGNFVMNRLENNE